MDVEPVAAKANESPEEKLAQWKSEVTGSAPPLFVEPGDKGESEKVTEKAEVSPGAELQQAEGRFEQTQWLSHGCQQSLSLLQREGRGPACRINGLFYWNADDSLILLEVEKAAELPSHGEKDYVCTLNMVRSSLRAHTGSP